MKDTQWILFAKRPSRDNCLGKGRISNCYLVDTKATYNPLELVIDMTLDGVRFMGVLRQATHDEEE